MKIKEIAFTSYPVTDLPKARHFYEEVLGMTPTSVFESDDMGFIEYELGTHTFAIGKGASQFKPGKAGGVVAFEVEDFDAAVKRLKDNAAVFVSDAMDYPSCSMIIVEDPEGNQLMIHKRKEK